MIDSLTKEIYNVFLFLEAVMMVLACTGLAIVPVLYTIYQAMTHKLER